MPSIIATSLACCSTHSARINNQIHSGLSGCRGVYFLGSEVCGLHNCIADGLSILLWCQQCFVFDKFVFANLLSEFLARGCCGGVGTCHLWVSVLSEAREGQYVGNFWAIVLPYIL
jgi:hypothetical protein